MSKPKTMLVSELLDELSRLDPDDRLYFGNGDLSYYRPKYRGDKLVSIEFNEIYEVTCDPAETE